jgi:glycosyltransferase involved in cell wall biosynthesis
MRILKDTVLNIFANKDCKLSYVVESANWSIKQDGEYIAKNLTAHGLLEARVTTSWLGLRRSIVHFGSLNTLLTRNGFRSPSKSDKRVLTIFHIVPEDKRLRFLPDVLKYVAIVHTASSSTKSKLVELGLPKEKIVAIPLGVDLSLFRPASLNQRENMRNALGIPLDKVVIGSFQKDGNAWGKGLEPKLIKGPDIFIRVVEKLATDYPIFVLLVGPARGYVEDNLKKSRIPYRSIGYLDDFTEVAKYYKALDLYLIASRIEGGPKQILEAWASGVPVVSTKVGMVVDIATGEEDILLANTEDVNGLVSQLERIINSKSLKNKLVRKGLETIKNYSWESIARRYYKDIYSKL